MFYNYKTSYLKIVYSFICISCMLSMFIIDGCSDSSSPKNNKPSIDLITATPDKLAYGEQSTITVTATDKDNDNLTFSWSCDNGSFASGNTTNSVTWEAPEEVGTCGVTVTVSDGEEEVTASVSIEIMGLFFDEFKTDLSNWSNSYCSSWISSEEVHVKGSTNGFFGTITHNMDEYLSPEYTVNMNVARIDNFSSDQYYGLYTEVNDDGDIVIPYWVFGIEPSTSNENWLVIGFIWSYSQATGGWAYLEDNSHGNSTLINTSVNAFNNLSWTIEQDKRVKVRVGDNLLYQSDEISNLENTFGITITMDLVCTGVRTRYSKEVKFDDVVITTPSNISPKTVSDKNSSRDQSQLYIRALRMIPKENSKLKTMREFLSEIKK